ncbi:MAG: transporter permease [Microbacterium sp.]|jgi:osmoprotectant transport system permease protein|nr:transporter permease [Microbacterium sp.]
MWVVGNLDYIGGLLMAHLAVTLPALALSIVIAVPLGRLAVASGRGQEAVVTTTGLLYAIPSLPLLITIPLLTGLPLRSTATMITALTIYGVAILVRSATDAFANVPRNILDVAAASGMSARQSFFGVELPLALPVLIAGARVVAMSTVGLATIGALIGIPSLGSLLTDGFQRGITAEVTAGIVLTLAVALILDGCLWLTGRLTQPWTTPHRAGITA